MGAGKSTVGGLVADLLDFELVDTDKAIEERQHRRVADIFAEQGEPAFRALEAALVQELGTTEGRVIATGGGLPMNPESFAALKRHSFVACLWASAETVFQRVRYQSHRPLLHAPDPLARIRELLEQRRPVYRQADLLVGVDYRAPIESARYIVGAFRQAAGRTLPRHAVR